MKESNNQITAVLDSIYQHDSRQILATLIRPLGDFDLAGDAMQEAFMVATDSWATKGIPANPKAWLIFTGRFKAIDITRKKARFKDLIPQLKDSIDEASYDPRKLVYEDIIDDQLRLIFTCCHFSLSEDARIALILRIVCDLSTMGQAKRFYQSVIENTLEKLETRDDSELWSFSGDLGVYGANGAQVKMPGFPVGGNSVLVYFGCPDHADIEARVEENGGRIEKTKFSIGEYGYISLVYDTEGNMIGLHSMI